MRLKTSIHPPPFTKCVFCHLVFLAVFSVFLISVGASYNGNNNTHPEKLLLEHLLQEYESNALPQLSPDEGPVTVTLHLYLMRIVEMNVKTQILTTYLWMTMEWVDQRLQWDPEDYANITDVRIPIKQLWIPDFEVYNSASEDVSLTDGMTSTVVKSNGTVNWIEPKTINTMCAVDVTYFPFDQQTCKLKLGSWTRHGFQINIEKKKEKVELDKFAHLGDWKIVSTNIVKSTNHYPGYPNPYLDITASIVLQRKPMHFVCTIILPWVLLSIVTALSLSLPLDSPIRTAVQIFIMAAFSVFMSWDITSELPDSPDSTPLILIYMVVMMILSGLAVIFTMVILKVFNYGKHPTSRPVPQWLRWALSGEIPFHVANSSIPSVKVNGSTGVACNDVTTTRDDIPLTQYSTLDPFDQLEASPSMVADVRGHIMTYPESRNVFMSGTTQQGVPCNISNTNSACTFHGRRIQSEGNLVCEEWKLLGSKLDTICFRVFAVSISLVNLSLVILTF